MAGVGGIHVVRIGSALSGVCCFGSGILGTGWARFSLFTRDHGIPPVVVVVLHDALAVRLILLLISHRLVKICPSEKNYGRINAYFAVLGQIHFQSFSIVLETQGSHGE
jgi:hypothetical protein